MLLFKVFTRAEIALICNLCVAHNVVVIADEVYEHMVSRLHSRATQTNKKVKKGQQEILTRLTNAKEARVFGNWKL